MYPLIISRILLLDFKVGFLMNKLGSPVDAGWSRLPPYYLALVDLN